MQSRRKQILFLISQAVTLFGSSIVQFAIIWYVTLHTSSGVWVSALTIAAYLPQFVISFFAGVWADRYSRKLLIILSDGGIAVATLLLVFMYPYINDETPLLVALIIISILRSVGAGIQVPAVNAVIPQLVSEDKLMKFNGVNATVQSFIQFLSPAVAGSVLSFSTFQITLMLDIITAIVGIGVLVAIAIPFQRVETETTVMQEMKAGYQYAVKEKFIGGMLIIFGIFIFLCVPAGFLASLFISRYYGETYWYMTLVEIIGFLGMAGGGLLLSAWGGFKNRVKTLFVGVLAFGLLAIGMGLIKSLIVYFVLMAVYGVALTIIQTACTTIFQEQTAPEMQGRVFGLFGAMYSGFLPLGMAVFGPLADIMSMRVLMVGSGVCLIAIALFLVLNRKFYHHGEVKEEEQ